MFRVPRGRKTLQDISLIQYGKIKYPEEDA